MKLELNIFDIENIRFGEKTAINEGILSIDRKALQDLVLDWGRAKLIDWNQIEYA